jgi:hypothetical protein
MKQAIDTTVSLAYILTLFVPSRLMVQGCTRGIRPALRVL